MVDKHLQDNQAVMGALAAGAVREMAVVGPGPVVMAKSLQGA